MAALTELFRFQSENMTISVTFEDLSVKSVDNSRYLTLSEVTITEQFNMAGIRKDSGPGKFLIIAEV